jgi:hypothetical protein
MPSSVVHIPGQPSVDPMPAVRLLSASEVLLTLLLPNGVDVMGMCLFEGPASCRTFRIVRVDGRYPTSEAGHYRALVTARLDYTEQHEFRVGPSSA